MTLGAATASGAVTRDGIAFDRVVDAVDDLGMDPTGSTRVDDALAAGLDDGTLIVFPDGDYLLGGVSLGGRRSIGMVAADGARPTFVAPGSLGDWLRFPNCDEVLVEGFDFDMRGAGVGGTLNFQMDGSWILRDVRKLGQHPDTQGGFRLAANDPDSTGLAERCVATGGAVDGAYSVGMFVPPAHGGEVTIRDCHVANFSNNGLYASPPGHTSDGAVKVEGGLYRNNNIAAVRLGSTGSYARNVTIVNDRAAPAGHGARNQRGFYLRRGGDGIAIENCDVFHDYEGAGAPFTIGSAASGSSCSVTGCRIGNDTGNPAIYCNDSVLDGWSGSGNSLTGSGNTAAPSGWISCQGSDCERPTAEPVRSVSPRSGRGADGSGGSGGSDGGSDGPTETPTESPTETATPTPTETATPTPTPEPEPDLPRTLVVDSSDAQGQTTYSFTVSGGVERSGELGSLDGADSVDGSTASGATWGGVDGYRFEGEIEELTLDGPATLLVDGEEVDPAEFADDPALPNTLVVDSSDVDGRTSYSFTVSDGIERSGELGSLDGADSVDGDTATGATWGGVDGYRFAGEITDATFEGDAALYVNGVRVDPARYADVEDPLPRRIVVDGSVIDGQANYEFTVDGEVRPDDDAEDDDAVEDATVTGTVGNDADAFLYSGQVVSLRVDGAAAIRLEETDA